jgi:hypothetical protein
MGTLPRHAEIISVVAKDKVDVSQSCRFERNRVKEPE